LKFQAVAEKTAKDARGLLYFAAPGTSCIMISGGRTEQNVVIGSGELAAVD